MAGLGVFVPQNSTAVCLIRNLASDAVWEADENGELCAWTSASHPLVPTQTEINNTETSITTNPELCNPGDLLVENAQGDALIEVDPNGVLLLDNTPISALGQDNLGDHTATQNLDMAGFEIDNVSALDASAGSSLVIRSFNNLNIINTDPTMSNLGTISIDPNSEITLLVFDNALTFSVGFAINSGGFDFDFDPASDLKLDGNPGLNKQHITSSGPGLPPQWGFVDYSDIVNVPASFPPSAHTHVLADITDLNNTDDLTEGIANLYYTEARVSANTDVAANTAARHDAVTLNGVSDPRLALAAQELNLDLSDLDTALTDITNLQADSHVAVTLNGASDPRLTLTGQDLTLDLTDLNTALTDIAALQTDSHIAATAGDDSVNPIGAGQTISVNLDTVTPNNALVLTPGEGLYVPESANGFAVAGFARTSTGGVLVDGTNLTVVPNGVGVYDYTFVNQLPDANYSVVADNFNQANDNNHTVQNVTDTGFRLRFGTGDNGGTIDVPINTQHSVVVYSTAFAAPSTTVQSVNGEVGVVVLDTSDVAENTNLYYTEARVSANADVAANTASRHDPVTLNAGTDTRLSLTGQELNFNGADIDTNTTDITALQTQAHDLATPLDDSIIVGGTGQQIQVQLDTVSNGGNNLLSLTPGEGLFVNPTGSLPHAVINLTGQTDVNASLVGNTILLDSLKENSLPGLAVNFGANNFNLNQGSYLFFLNISLTANSNRTNQGVRSVVGGVGEQEFYLPAYIRNGSGHNEAGGTYIAHHRVAGTVNFSLEIFRLAGAGVVTLDPLRSRLVIMRMSS